MVCAISAVGGEAVTREQRDRILISLRGALVEFVTADDVIHLALPAKNKWARRSRVIKRAIADLRQQIEVGS